MEDNKPQPAGRKKKVVYRPPPRPAPAAVPPPEPQPPKPLPPAFDRGCLKAMGLQPSSSHVSAGELARPEQQQQQRPKRKLRKQRQAPKPEPKPPEPPRSRARIVIDQSGPKEPSLGVNGYCKDNPHFCLKEFCRYALLVFSAHALGPEDFQMQHLRALKVMAAKVPAVINHLEALERAQDQEFRELLDDD
ncbi:MAG TPA: hypothetical protein VMP01_27160 [Pirellulaceae bacterium]|nr:hypothetical protein [Pirellulaceae bacterium]